MFRTVWAIYQKTLSAAHNLMKPWNKGSPARSG